jgi:uncharacterized membrane protein
METLEKKAPSQNLHKGKSQINQGSASITALTSFSGPIPPPIFLEHYEKIVPGIAKRFLEEPHLEAEHRRGLEKLMVEEKIRLSKRGQGMAFFLATSCVFAAFASIFFGYDIAGLGALFISIASFVAIFLYAKKHQT